MKTVGKDYDNTKLIQSIKALCTVSNNAWGFKLLKGLIQSEDDE